MTYNFNLNELGIYKITQIIEKISIKSFILLKKAQALVQKTSRKNLTSSI